ncbi:MAG TPA: diguanylate cyclase [Candidatus Acidoferrum sp.]|jgi:diguanylate cyclase (GGDEF)-like protein
MSDRPKKILLVEDDANDAALLQRFLGKQTDDNFAVVLISKLSDAQAALAAHPPDLILLDLNLPDSQGLATVRHMLHLARTVPIIVLTGSDDEHLAADAVQAGAQDYLTKGQVDARTFPRALRYAMERHRLKTTVEAQTVTDELTNLSNRRGFLTLARRHFDLARRNQTELLLVHTDLDSFESITANLGHEHAASAIREAAAVLRSSLRTTDVVGRFGAGEFAVLAVDVRPPGPAVIPERIAREIRLRNLAPNRRYKLSMSLASCTWTRKNEPSLDALMARANAALSESKQLRNSRFSTNDFSEEVAVFSESPREVKS